MRVEPEIKRQLTGARRLQVPHHRAKRRALLQLAGDLAQRGEIGKAEKAVVPFLTIGLTRPHFSR